MKPRFTAERDKLFVTDDAISNGHWVMFKRYARLKTAPKAFRNLLSLNRGVSEVLSHKRVDLERDPPDLDALVPNKRDGYFKMATAPTGVSFNHDEIAAYKFNVLDGPFIRFQIGIAPRYVPLLRMGVPFAKDNVSPVLILDGADSNDVVIGMVMPVRI